MAAVLTRGVSVGFGDGPAASVNLKQVRRVVSNVYATRDNLAQSLTDANSIAESLASVVVAGLRMLGFFAALWVCDVDVNALFVSFSSIVLGLAFVFGGVMKEYFEAAVFLFSVHPYDVGDWIAIGGDWYEVKRIELNHTLLQSLTGAKAMWANAVLRTKHPLENLSREMNYTEQWTMAVDSKCFGEGVVEKVKAKLQEYALRRVCSTTHIQFRPRITWKMGE